MVNKEVEQVRKIFEEDEMNLVPVDPGWTPEQLLNRKGIFFLKDVVKVLGLDPLKVKKKARDLARKGESAWEVMGARKVWNHWVVRMVVFSVYYREHLLPRFLPVDERWDGNTLLGQRGVYLLTDVCKRIPFSTHQLRYQAKQVKNARERLGIWKDEELNAFVVDMEKFAVWIQKLWSGHYQQK